MLTQLVGSLGFPIVACAYMMISMGKTLSDNTKATNSLAALVQSLIDKMGFKASELKETPVENKDSAENEGK